MLQSTFNPGLKLTGFRTTRPRAPREASHWFAEEKKDHVSYSVPRPIHRLMHRSMYRSLLDRPSTDTRLTCRSTVDRCFGRASTDVGRGIDRDHMGSISVNYRRDIGQLSVECRSCIIRQSSESLPILSADLSTDTIDQYIDLYQILSIDISTDILIDTRYYPPMYRPIPDTIDPYIDRYQIISTDVSTNVSADTRNVTRVFIVRSSVDQCINQYIDRYQPKHLVKVKYH